MAILRELLTGAVHLSQKLFEVLRSDFMSLLTPTLNAVLFRPIEYGNGGPFSKEWSEWVWLRLRVQYAHRSRRPLGHRRHNAPLRHRIQFHLSRSEAVASTTGIAYSPTFTNLTSKIVSHVQHSLQELRPISTPRLSALLHVHLVPINLIISQGT